MLLFFVVVVNHIIKATGKLKGSLVYMLKHFLIQIQFGKSDLPRGLNKGSIHQSTNSLAQILSRF